MDLTIPYTFYPIAMPGWLSWLLFSAAVLGAMVVGGVAVRRRGVIAGMIATAISFPILLAATMFISMILTFFIHDL